MTDPGFRNIAPGTGQNGSASPGEHGMVTPRHPVLPPILVWCFLIFLFSIPFEFLDLSRGESFFTLSKLFGLLFAAFALLLRPKVCFARPPMVFWLFLAYVLVYWGEGIIRAEYTLPTTMSTLTVVQCLVLFWLSFNVLRCGVSPRAVLYAMLLSTCLLAVLVRCGFGAPEVLTPQDVARETGFGYDPNHLAYVYTIGALAGLGLTVDRSGAFVWRMAAAVMVFGLVGMCVATGSRGGMLCLGVSLVAFCFVGGDVARGVRVSLAAVVLVAGLVLVIVRSESAMERWHRVIFERDLSSRDTINRVCLEMISRKPLFGWGPVAHLQEVAIREGYVRGLFRDTHSDILWAFTSTGLAGGVFFLGGIWWLFQAAWRGRRSRYGAIRLSLITATVVFGMTCTAHKRKPFWICAALAATSGAMPTDPRRNDLPGMRPAASRNRFGTRHWSTEECQEG